MTYGPQIELGPPFLQLLALIGCEQLHFGQLRGQSIVTDAHGRQRIKPSSRSQVLARFIDVILSNQATVQGGTNESRLFGGTHAFPGKSKVVAGRSESCRGGWKRPPRHDTGRRPASWLGTRRESQQIGIMAPSLAGFSTDNLCG